MMSKQIVAVFDFDGTLISGLPSRLLFIKHLVGLPKLLGGLLLALPYFFHKKIRSRTRSDDDWLDQLFLVGWSRDELEHQAALFVEKSVVNKVRPIALERLQFHQRQGHICILISGAFELYLKVLAEKYTIQHVIGSELEFDKQNISTGHIVNGYCLGKEKVSRLSVLLAERKKYIIYAYGDSQHDKVLLDYADYGFYRTFE